MRDPEDGIGVFVFVMGSELAELSRKAAAYHSEQSKALRAQADQLRLTLKSDEMRVVHQNKGYSTTNVGDPIAEVEERAATHTRRGRMHAFLAEHYDVERNYTLRLSDLAIYGYTWN